MFLRISLSIFVIACTLHACAQPKSDIKEITEENDGILEVEDIEKISRSEEEWKEMLSEHAFEVMRMRGTEPAFSGKFVDWNKEGIFYCKGCDLPLFSTIAKFKSGTGWPSFYRPIDADVFIRRNDTRLGTVRTEVICARCESHHGHIFTDGIEPTGLRYCVNSVALTFRPKDLSEIKR